MPVKQRVQSYKEVRAVLQRGQGSLTKGSCQSSKEVSLTKRSGQSYKGVMPVKQRVQSYKEVRAVLQRGHASQAKRSDVLQRGQFSLTKRPGQSYKGVMPV